jgi:hypothetical protein
LTKQTIGLSIIINLDNGTKRAQKYFPIAGTLLSGMMEIIAYFDNRRTSGVVEGITTSSN